MKNIDISCRIAMVDRNSDTEESSEMELILESDPERFLSSLLTSAGNIIKETRERILEGSLSVRPYLVGQIPEDKIHEVLACYKRFYEKYPKSLEKVFEDPPIEDIRATSWTADDEATIRMQFGPQCKELPAHTHDHSDRVILVTDGEGMGLSFPGVKKDFHPSMLRVTPVRIGTVLAYPRGVVHTFEAGPKGIELSTVHVNKFIPFNEAEQFTLMQQRE